MYYSRMYCPVVLRPSKKEEGRFTLLGDMLLSNMMYGEALQAQGFEERYIIHTTVNATLMMEGCDLLFISQN
jgi:hypothetical protein